MLNIKCNKYISNVKYNVLIIKKIIGMLDVLAGCKAL